MITWLDATAGNAISEPAYATAGRSASRLVSAVDWLALGLWSAATLVAVSLLAAAMNRRRTALTESLRKHVVDTVGTLGDKPGEDEQAL